MTGFFLSGKKSKVVLVQSRQWHGTTSIFTVLVTVHMCEATWDVRQSRVCIEQRGYMVSSGNRDKGGGGWGFSVRTLVNESNSVNSNHR